MKVKLCYYTTGGLKEAVEKYAPELGTSKTSFINMALKKFLRSERLINPEFLIEKRTDPNYVPRPEMDQVYILPEINEELEAVAAYYKCAKAIIVFQALYDMCYELMENDMVIKF